LSVRECIWVSIWKVWMCTSRLDNLTNFIGPVQIESFNIGINCRYYVTGQGLWGKHSQLSWTFTKICMVIQYFITWLPFTSRGKKIAWKTSGSQKYSV
jgi:hypothetical protein